MGLLITGMAYLFNLHIDSAKREAIRDEINLAEAVEAHINWKLRLQSYLDGKLSEPLDSMVVCRDDQCKLGKWIHGPALKHFHEMEPFHQLRADHAQFHFVAAKVVTNVQENNRAAADAILHGEYQQISHKVVMAITELNSLVNP